MTKEQLEKCAGEFFGPQRDDSDYGGHDIGSGYDVELFYRELSLDDDERGFLPLFEIDSVGSGGYESLAALVHNKSLNRSIVSEWEVKTRFDSVGELVEYVMRLEAEARSLADRKVAGL